VQAAGSGGVAEADRGDYDGGQRVVSRFALIPQDDGALARDGREALEHRSGCAAMTAATSAASFTQAFSSAPAVRLR
jgi:hypothetical protein